MLFCAGFGLARLYTEYRNAVVEVRMLEDRVSSRVWKSTTISYNSFLPSVRWLVSTHSYIFFGCYVVVAVKGLCGHRSSAHVVILERSTVVPRR